MYGMYSCNKMYGICQRAKQCSAHVPEQSHQRIPAESIELSMQVDRTAQCAMRTAQCTPLLVNGHLVLGWFQCHAALLESTHLAQAVVFLGQHLWRGVLFGVVARQEFGTNMPI